MHKTGHDEDSVNWERLPPKRGPWGGAGEHRAARCVWRRTATSARRPQRRALRGGGLLCGGVFKRTGARRADIIRRYAAGSCRCQRIYPDDGANAQVIFSIVSLDFCIGPHCRPHRGPRMRLPLHSLVPARCRLSSATLPWVACFENRQCGTVHKHLSVCP